MSADVQAPKSPIDEKVNLIMSDLSPRGPSHFIIRWDTRPLRPDDVFWQSPEDLDDGSPRFWVVSVTVDGHANVHVTDAQSPVWIRDYYMADWAQDEVSEDTREPLPGCPVHSHTLMRAEIEGEHLLWKCTRDDAIRCNLGTYWSWQSSLKTAGRPTRRR
jgi:hypothetical protein